jgi:hypothetical protein
MDQLTLGSIISFAKLIHSSAWLAGVAALVLAVLILVYIKLTGKLSAD